MDRSKTRKMLAALLAFGLLAPVAHAEQYDPPINIATLACPAGSTGYGNARFIAFPFFGGAPANWRITIWCSAGGGGRRGHFEPGAGGVFTAWGYAGGLFGAGWPPPPNYGNAFQAIDIDSDGDLDMLHLQETSANTWTVFLSRAL